MITKKRISLNYACSVGASFFVFASIKLVQSASAEENPPGAHDLNLASTKYTVAAPSAGKILVGGQVSKNGSISGATAMTVVPGQLLTPAMSAALWQSNGGGQSLLIGNSGAAVGGTARFDSSWNNVSSLVVPTAVSISLLGFNPSIPLNVTGAASVLGSLHALQTVQGMAATLNFGSNLTIAEEALLSTSLPASQSLLGVFASSDLNLTVAGNLINNGTISVPGGNLNLNAQGSVSNVTTPGYSTASMTAQSINIFTGTGNIVNSGLISATNAVSLHTTDPHTDLIINNTNGVVEALGENGIITVRSQGPDLESANAGIWGGLLKAGGGINMYGKKMIVDANRIEGAISNFGSEAYIQSYSGDLVLGRQILSGDPTYYSTGNLAISDLTTVFGNLVMLASGDITLSHQDTTIKASAASSIFIGAGINFDITPNSGAITGFDDNDSGNFFNSLSNFCPGTGSINTAGRNLNLSTTLAGNITLVASNGSINLGAGTVSTTIGSVLIIGEHGVSTNGPITTTAGSITIASATPANLSTMTVLQPGTIILGTPTVGTLTENPVKTADLGTTLTGNICVQSAGTVEVGAICSTGIVLVSGNAGATVNGAIDNSGLLGKVTVNASAGAISIAAITSNGAVCIGDLLGTSGVTLNGIVTSLLGSVEILSSSGTITGNNNSITSMTGTITVDPGSGKILSLGDLTCPGNVLLGTSDGKNSKASGVEITGAINNGSGLASSVTVLSNTGGISAGAISSKGDVLVKALDAVASGAVTVGGTIDNTSALIGSVTVDSNTGSVSVAGIKAKDAIVIGNSTGATGITLSADLNNIAGLSGVSVETASGGIEGSAANISTKGAVLLNAAGPDGGDLSINNVNNSAGISDINIDAANGSISTGSLTSKGAINVGNVTGATGVTLDGALNNAAGTDDITIQSQSGGISTKDITTNGNVVINGSSLSSEVSTTISGKSVSISGLPGADLTVDNAATITASTGTIVVVSAPGTGLNISGDGFMNAKAGGVTLTATTLDTSANNVHFTGGQTFNGDTVINAAGDAQSIIVDYPAAVVGNDKLTLHSQYCQIEGTISGNPLVMEVVGAGTIANASGKPLDLKSLGNLVFNGASLSIISAGNIVNTGKAKTIDLSNSAASGYKRGGTLTLLAGFNFAGASSNTPVNTVFSNFTLNPAGGKIKIPNVTIITSSKNGAGGNVFAAANGTVSLGPIITTGAALGGSVRVIGKGITVGAITTSGGANSGSVSLTSATPQVNGPLVINSGIMFNGGITGTNPAGNVFFKAINAGSGKVNLTTGGTGTFRQGGILTSGLLSINAGIRSLSLRINSSAVQINTLAGANVTLNSTTFTTLMSSIIGGNLNLSSIHGLGIGAEQAIMAAGNIRLLSSNADIGITGGASSVLIAGSLKPLAPASPLPLLNANIQRAGSITLMTTGRGTAGISLGNKSSFTSNGAGITLRSNSPNADLNIAGSSVLQANGGSIRVTSGKALSLNGNNVTLTARALSGGAGGITLSAVRSLSISNGTTIQANKAVMLSSSSAGSTMLLANNVSVKAGSGTGAPAGSLTIRAMGTGPLSFSTGTDVDLESNLTGLNIMSNGGILIGDKYTIRSNNKGSVSISSKKDMTIGVTGGSASALVQSGSNGSIRITSSTNLTLGAGSIDASNGSFFAVKSMKGSSTVSGTTLKAKTTGSITAATGVLLDKASSVSTLGNLTVSASNGSANLTFSNGVQLKAGSLTGSAPAAGVLNPIDIATKGSLILTAGGAVSVANNNSWSVNGGNLQVTARGVVSKATGSLTLGSSNQFKANGGNIILLAKGTITGANSNSFDARGYGTSASNSMGGGIEIGSGLTNSKLMAAFSQPAGTNPTSPNALGTGVLFTGNVNGVIQTNTKGSGTINLNAGANGPSTLTLNGIGTSRGGVQLFDAMGDGAAINFDHATFNTVSLKPIGMTTQTEVDDYSDKLSPFVLRSDNAGSSELRVGNCCTKFYLYKLADGTTRLVAADHQETSGLGKSIASIHCAGGTILQHTTNGDLNLIAGEVFVNTFDHLRLNTKHGILDAKIGALFVLKSVENCSYLRVCSGPGTVCQTVGGTHISLSSAEELMVSTQAMDLVDARSADGVARRFTHNTRIGNKHLSISDFSMLALLKNSDCLTKIIQSNNPADKHLLQQLLKTAASVEIALKHRGVYKAN